jgi:hypothetical protein
VAPPRLSTWSSVRLPWPCLLGPPYDPGRSVFPSPVLASALHAIFRKPVFPGRQRLKRWHAYTPDVHSSPAPSLRSRATADPQHCVWVRAESSEPPSAQSPFARRGCYPRRGGLQGRLGGRYSPFKARTGSCASPTTSHRFRVTLCVESPQVAAIPCWSWDLPDIIPGILAEAIGPIPRRVPQVHSPISSLGASASRYGKHVRHTGVPLRCDFDREPDFGAAVIR